MILQRVQCRPDGVGWFCGAGMIYKNAVPTALVERALFFYPNGIPSISPRVAESARLPWDQPANGIPTLKGLQQSVFAFPRQTMQPFQG